MKRFYITKQFTFEMAHALLGYPGKCSNIHGHSYTFEVTVTGERREESGMVIDFKELKDIVNKTIIEHFDHHFVVSQQADPALLSAIQKNFKRVNIVPFQPSTENLLDHFLQLLQSQLPSNVQLYALRLQETEQSWVELRIEP